MSELGLFAEFRPRDADEPRESLPDGVIVRPACMEDAAGMAKLIAERAREAFYFANSLNLATIDLHTRFGFRQFADNFKFPGARFSGGGHGLLFHVDLRDPAVIREITSPAERSHNMAGSGGSPRRE